MVGVEHELPAVDAVEVEAHQEELEDDREAGHRHQAPARLIKSRGTRRADG